MALFQLDDKQFQELKGEIRALTQAVNDLSANVGKWQGSQTTAVQAGLAGLIGAITGADIEEIQQRINNLAGTVKTTKESLQTAIDKQPKGD